MKNLVLLSLLSLILVGCAYRRIGDLNMLSNRNIDKATDYVLIQRNVEGKGQIKKKDPLESAVDNATESVKGEYLMNVKIYVKDNGKRVKVVGDVWGIKKDNKTIKQNIKIGDAVKVILKNKSVLEGKAIEIDNNRNAIRVNYKKGNKELINWFSYDNVMKKQ